MLKTDNLQSTSMADGTGGSKSLCAVLLLWCFDYKLFLIFYACEAFSGFHTIEKKSIETKTSVFLISLSFHDK